MKYVPLLPFLIAAVFYIPRVHAAGNLTAYAQVPAIGATPAAPDGVPLQADGGGRALP